jgi:sulfite dehydrogenase (cytochrome) subunit B
MRAAIAAMAAALPLAALAAPPRYEAPPETARLAPAEGSEVAQAHCLTCHSADYVITQPRGLANPTAFWTADVAKMRKAYGAQISDEDSARIVAYLVAAYGK